MENQQVYDDAVVRILELCRTEFSGEINAFYEGDPIDIPKASLPAIIVEEMSTNITLTGAPTGHDHFVTTVSIRVLYNKADDLGASDDMDLTERKLRRFIGARDPLTGSYKEGTLLKLLRTHLTLSNLQFNANVDINYDLNPRPNQVVTSEGQLTITAEGNIVVGTRD